VIGNDLEYNYKLVDNWDDLRKLVSYCKITGYASTDFETNGESPVEDSSYPTILGVSFQMGGAWIIPLGHKDSPIKNWKKALRYFGREVIANPNIVKIGQNINFEMRWWKKYGITMVGRVFDTMLAKYLLDEERPHGLKEMVSRFIPEFDGYDLKGVPSSKSPRERIKEFWSNVPLDDLSKYCALDSDLTFRLWTFFERRLIDNNFYPLFRNMLMMASRVLADSEYRGMDIDVEYLKGLVNTYREKIIECDKEIREIPLIKKYEVKRLKKVKKKLIDEVREEIEEIEKNGGNDRLIKNREEKISRYLSGDFTTKKEKALLDPLNFNSSDQMVDLLFLDQDGFNFNVIKFTEDKKTKRQTDRPSTDEEVLVELKTLDDTGFIEKLLELRGLTKLNSTYVVGMWERLTLKNKIHGSFLLHGTVTGRLSSRNPNLQNIPRDTTASDIKKMFIPPKGKLILQLDYSQAELRVLAELAKEENMINAFNSGHDIHLATACKKYKVDYDLIENILEKEDKDDPDYILWKVRRKQAKTTNFGIAYEQSAKKLALKLTEQGIHTTEEEAKQFLIEWFEDFPKVKKFIDKQHRYAEKHGYVYGLFGRKRRLPNVYSDNWGKKSEALRQSVNAPIQGSASDFALFSSILIRDYVRNGKLPKSLEQIGTVHDSLIFYIKPEDIHESVPILFDICKNPETKSWFNFEVKSIEMKVDFEVGVNWGELHPYNPKEDYSLLIPYNTINNKIPYEN